MEEEYSGWKGNDLWENFATYSFWIMSLLLLFVFMLGEELIFWLSLGGMGLYIILFFAIWQRVIYIKGMKWAGVHVVEGPLVIDEKRTEKVVLPIKKFDRFSELSPEAKRAVEIDTEEKMKLIEELEVKDKKEVKKVLKDLKELIETSKISKEKTEVKERQNNVQKKKSSKEGIKA